MRSRLLRLAGVIVLWALVAVPAAAFTFVHSSEDTLFAGHEVTVEPTFDGWATFEMGPYVPSFRHPSTARIGVNVDVGKTTAEDFDVLIERYAVIAGQPDAQIEKLRDVVILLAERAALTGALVGLVVPVVLLLVGRRRADELVSGLSWRRATAAGTVLVLVAAGVVWLLPRGEPPEVAQARWQPLQEAVPSVRLPEEASRVEIDRTLLTRGSTRLVESLVTSYESSKSFYTDLEDLVELAGDQIRVPAEGETVALLVSDRHDNIYMDPVVRELARVGGATVLLNAGDDTSSGAEWEAFSIESIVEAFSDFEHRFVVAGNHDSGDFITALYDDLGFTTLVGEPVEGPDGMRLFGASDPRSSGLGSWIDEREVSFSEQETLIADATCTEDEEGRRVGTLLVHDVNSGREALERGCVDLVLAGHRHEQVGPTQVVAEDGRVGYSYVNGTTGGAAYAIALGSKLRRNAQATLVTYRDGRPVGLQPVTFRTVKDIVVSAYLELDYPDRVVGLESAPDPDDDDAADDDADAPPDEDAEE